MQTGLDVSPLVSLVSVMVWSYLLGPYGALLALPITIALKRLWQDPPASPRRCLPPSSWSNTGEHMSHDRKKTLKALPGTAGTEFKLADRDPDRTMIPELEGLNRIEAASTAKQALKDNLDELSAAQEMLWANDVWSVLVILQAMDTAGKDGIIKHVMSGRQSAGLPGRVVQAALRGRARSHIPLALREGAAGAGTNRDLQPLLL